MGDISSNITRVTLSFTWPFAAFFNPIQQRDQPLNKPSIPDPRIEQIDDQALGSYTDLGPYIWEELSSKSWDFISFTWPFAVSFNPIQQRDQPSNKPSIPDPRIDQTTCR